MFNIRSFGQLTIVLNDYVLKNTIKANKSKYTNTHHQKMVIASQNIKTTQKQQGFQYFSKLIEVTVATGIRKIYKDTKQANIAHPAF